MFNRIHILFNIKNVVIEIISKKKLILKISFFFDGIEKYIS